VTLKRRIARAVAGQVSVPWHGIPGIGEPEFDWNFAAGHLPTAVRNALSRATVATSRDTGGGVVSVASGKARFGHDRHGRCKGLLVERERTQTLLNVSQFENANWIKFRSSVSASSALSPDGSNSADKLIEDATAANSHGLFQQFTGTAASWTFSVFAKAAERSWLALRPYDGSSVVATRYMNLSNGAWGAGGNGGVMHVVEDWGDGWYRFSLTVTMAASASCEYNVALASGDGGLVYDGDGSSGVHLFHAQAEPGETPSSPIFNATGTPVTRNADVLIDLPIQSTNVGAVRWQGHMDWSGGSTRQLWDMTDGTTDERWQVWMDGSLSQPGVYARTGGVTQFTPNMLGDAWEEGSEHVVAATFGTNLFELVLDGVLIHSDYSADAPTVDRFSLCQNRIGTNQADMHCRRFTFFPRTIDGDALLSLGRLRQWLPTDVSGCALWLDAEAGVTWVDNSSILIEDLSGTNPNASNATAGTVPDWVADGINGRPALVFDGVNDKFALDFSGLNPFSDRGAFSLFIVAQADDAAGTYAWFGAGNQASGTPVIEWRQNAGNYGFISRDDNGSPEGEAVAAGADADAHVISLTYAGGANAALKSWEDGAVVLNTTYNASATTQSLNQFSIGAAISNHVLANYFKGRIAALIVYDHAVPDADRALIERYLSRKYEISPA